MAPIIEVTVTGLDEPYRDLKRRAKSPMEGRSGKSVIRALRRRSGWSEGAVRSRGRAGRRPPG